MDKANIGNVHFQICSWSRGEEKKKSGGNRSFTREPDQTVGKFTCIFIHFMQRYKKFCPSVCHAGCMVESRLSFVPDFKTKRSERNGDRASMTIHRPHTNSHTRKIISFSSAEYFLFLAWKIICMFICCHVSRVLSKILIELFCLEVKCFLNTIS